MHAEARNHVGSGALHHVVQEYAMPPCGSKANDLVVQGMQCWHVVNKEYHHVNGGEDDQTTWFCYQTTWFCEGAKAQLTA